MVGILIVAAQPSPLLKPFVISGSTLYSNGTSCSNPDLNITNLNTGENRTARVFENYYRLMLCSDNVSANDILRFDVSADKVSETFNHTLTVDEMDAARLFYNITLSINSPPNILSYAPETSIHNLEGVLKTFNITTDQIVNVTWFGNGKEVDKDTNTTEASCTLAASETGVIAAIASNPNGTVNQTWFWRVVNRSPKLPLFIVSGFATYVNGGASRNFTMNVTNLNTSTTWQADTNSGSNYYRLILDYGECHPGDVLKFTARNMDAGTVNVSKYTPSPADQLNVRYNVTFDSVDVTVLVLDSNGTVHYQSLFLNHEPDFIVLNATPIACNLLNMTFESSGSGSTVTRIDGIENPVVHLYDAQADAWEEVTPDHCLTNEDTIIWSNKTAELPELRSDLSITGIAITDCWGTTPHSNITNTVNVTISNRGYIASDLSDVVLSGNGEMIDGRILQRIDPMTNATVTFEWVPEEALNYTVAIVVDPYNLIPELDEDNNSRSQEIVVERGTVIRVPHDYQTVLEVLPNVTAYSIVYVDDGVYISYGYLDKHTPAMKIKDTHHIKIIGNSHDASMLHLSAFVNRPGHDVIRIMNSSDIELRGFTVEARYLYCSASGPENIRIIAVKDSRNISLSDLKLIHGGDPRYDNTIMKIENSECVTIAGNHISGTSGNSGIYIIGSNNSTIRYNSVCRIGAAISLNGDNNSIHSNNFFGGGGDSGNNNHWNASSPVNYTFKGRTFTNYIGNYWHGYDSDYRIADQDNDGIWDTPKSLGGTATDYHPLVQPYREVYSLRVKSISVPCRIYTEVNNTIITVIRQDSILAKGVGVLLGTDVRPIEYKEVSMSATEEEILKYVWTPNEINFSEIYVSASVDDLITSFQAREEMPITVSNLPYNCRDNITDALLFLRYKQTPSSGSIGSFSTSAWAILAFSASGEDTDVKSEYGRSIAGYLASHPALPGNEFVLATLEDLARTGLAVSALGGDPTNFGGVNYLTMVKSYHDCVQFDDPASVNDDAFGILALVACGDPNATEMIDQSKNYIVSNQNLDGGWSKIIEDSASNATDGNATNTTFTITSDLRTTSLVIQALVAAGEPTGSSIIANASALLRRNIGCDGNFSNAITTAYAIQAIVAIGENPSEWRNVSLNDSKSPIDYLLSLQQPDGSFNYTKDTAFFPIDITAKVIPALAASPLPVRLGSADAYPLPEITLFGYIYTPEVIYVNTSCTVHGKLRCNGGMFNVSLLEDGVPAAFTTVRSIWHDSDSEIPFSLEWTPSKDGLVDLTIFVDSSNRVEEAHEHNNLSRNVFVNLPDLLVSNVTLPDEIFVNATNIVSAGVCGITDEEFNVTFLADGIPVGRTWIRGIKDSVNLSFEWRPNRTGNHTVSFVADSDGEVREECETNNATAVLAEVILPDLVPVNLTPRRAFVSARNDITVTINGTAEGFNVTLVEGNTVVANATNITCYVQKSVNLTYKPQSLGIHNFTVVVDPDADILETNETNNNLTVTINVTRTDLVPTKILPEIVYLNETSKVIVVVNGVAEGFNATLIAHARDFPNGTITIVNETGNMTNTTNTTNITNPMIVNTTNLDTYDNGNLTIRWRPYFQGWHNMTAIVDSDNNVNETNETNNNLTCEVFTANRIQLELVSPRGGKICGGIHPIKWKALHDKNLTINLSYSPNYGINWIPLASNLTCDPLLTANLTENLVRNATNATNTTNTTNATNITGGDYNGVYLWNTGDLSDGEYLIRITAQWYILEEMYTSNTIIVLNGDAASGGIGGNARYFDWDTPDEPHLAWASEDIFAGGSTSIVVADDRVFVYCTGGGVFKSSEYTYMVALNATNGVMLWATPIAANRWGSWASPAYHNGSVFIAAGHYLYRIDGETGAILWDYILPDGDTNCNGGPSVCGGKVFIGTYGRGIIACVDEDTGEELWNTSSTLPPLMILGSATPKYGRIYCGRGRNVYCLTMDDGTVAWNTSLQKDVFSTPVVVDGRCYAATYEFGQGFGGFNCLDAFNGSILWNVPVERTDSTPAHFAPRDSDKKYIYVVGGCFGFSGFAVYCFNATNGSSIWSGGDVGSWTNSVAVSRDAKVFAGVSGGLFSYNGLKCFDAYTGDELWSAPYGGSSPYIAYGRVYTIGGSRLYAFGQRELPDLVVTEASASWCTVHATIRNIGTGETNESFGVALRKSGKVIDECTVGALAAGEFVAVTLDPHGACGNLEVYADSGCDIPERNEYNNMREVQVPCGGGGSSSTGDNGNGDPGNGDGNTNYGGLGSGGGTGGFVGGGGYWNYYHVGAGADDVETTTTTSTQTIVNETESQGTQHRVEGYPMGAELESGGGGGGYFSYAMILAGLILAGLLVHGIRKERGRYRRPTK